MRKRSSSLAVRMEFSSLEITLGLQVRTRSILAKASSRTSSLPLKSISTALSFFCLTLQQPQELAVAFLFQILNRDEAQRGGIHAIAQAGGRRAILKDMPQVRTCLL